MNFDESLAYLQGLGHETLAINFDLKNIVQLLEALGQPQQKFLKVQIAGTNGKGSTAVMIEAIARAAGIKTALYTSPHLISITERLRFDGTALSPEQFAHLLGRVRAAVTSLVGSGALKTRPTFFEHLTAMFLVGCADAPPELAILETGLGGRLDATTAARAEAVALTPISLDHQEYLGQTLVEVAAEKAAIIHRGATAVVIAPQEPAAMEVLRGQCARYSITPLLADCETEVHGAYARGRLEVTFRTPVDVYQNVRLNLAGRHQIINASLAITLAEALRERHCLDIPRAAIIAGLERAEHAGRLEWQEGEPAFLFDGAHNTAGARALRAYLDEFVREPFTLLFAAMRDKDLSGMAAQLFPAAQRLILTEMDNARTATREMLGQLAFHHTEAENVTLTNSVSEAIDAALERTSPPGLICVTGSLYLIGEVRATVQGAADKIHVS